LRELGCSAKRTRWKDGARGQFWKRRANFNARLDHNRFTRNPTCEHGDSTSKYRDTARWNRNATESNSARSNASHGDSEHAAVDQPLHSKSG
jgi:hypothetical protein